MSPLALIIALLEISAILKGCDDNKCVCTAPEDACAYGEDVRIRAEVIQSNQNLHMNPPSGYLCCEYLCDRIFDKRCEKEKQWTCKKIYCENATA